MPASLIWDDQAHTIMLATYTDPWTWSEYLAVGNDMLAWLERADDRLDVIVDLSMSQEIPPGLTWAIVEYVHQSGPLAHPRLDTMVVALSGTLYTAWFGLFAGLVPGVAHKMVQALSLEEARALLAWRRAGQNGHH